MAHQMAMASKVLKSRHRDGDLRSSAAVVNGDDTTPTARTTEAFPHWLARAKDKTGAVAGAIAPGTSVAGLPTC